MSLASACFSHALHWPTSPAGWHNRRFCSFSRNGRGMGAAFAGTVSKNLLEGPHVHRNLSTPQLVEAAIARGEASLASNGALVALTGARTGRSPRDKFLVKDAVDRRSRGLGQGEPAVFAGPIRRVAGTGRASHAGARPVCARPLRGCRSSLQAADHRRGGVCVACLLREAALRAPRCCRTGRACSRVHRDRCAGVRSGARTRWHHFIDFHHHRLQAQDRPDRRHQICGRDEEVHLRSDELSAAGTRCVPHALLGQHRRRWPDGAVLRSLRHGKDDTLRRSESSPDRR